ncbi:hypothetical protein [Erythrobacter crassostreae]|uniref:Uncharacterized protein n=1 Tax=Erythrobacter crassostreae TaxID=2828328 RepID=A0A9X1JK78_9SPHN|nr:hypothetical protein [Erythrobacter crassostrea]MBV7258715.1 hypothetical protein [Erythrobacter crassostrea]
MPSETSADLLEKFAQDRSSGGILSTLEPASSDAVRKILNEFPGISEQYLDFITVIGVGATRDEEFYILEPESAREYVDHQSFQIYNSPSSKALFSSSRPPQKIPENLVGVVSTGGSWRYCVRHGQGDAVFCLSFSDSQIDEEAADFFSFVNDLLANVDEG